MIEPNEEAQDLENSDVDAASARVEVEIPDDVIDTATDDDASVDARVQDAEERVLRAQAELENFRRRSRREMETNLKFANQDLLKDLFPAIDNLYRAAEAAADNAEAKGLMDGVLMVAQQMLDTLDKHGCIRVSPLGEPFDPNLHEAISQGPSDEHESGNVMLVVQEGYSLHGRVLRPANVIVSTGPATPDDE